MADADLRKYRQMLSIGLPASVVRQRMINAGLSPDSLPGLSEAVRIPPPLFFRSNPHNPP